MPTVDEILGPQTADDVLGPPPAEEDTRPTVDELLKPAPESGAFAGAARVAKAAGEAVGHLFKGRFGLSEESMAPFVSQTPEETGGPMGAVRAFNRVLLESGSTAVDVVMRAVAAPIVGGAAAVTQTARELGMDDSWAKRLERDLLGLALAAGMVTGNYPVLHRGSPVFRDKAREHIAKAADELPPEVRAEARHRMAESLDEGMRIGEREAGPLPPKPITEPRITQPVSKNVVDAAEELLTVGGVQRTEGRLIADQIMELLQTRRLTNEQIEGILTKHSLSPDAFAELWRVNIRKAAQDMQTLSALEQRLKSLSRKTPDGADDLIVPWLDENTRGINWWQRVDNVRRGLMVTQISTAVRNFETQVGRVGLDTLQQGVDAGLRRMFSSAEVRAAHPIDAFGTWANIFWRPRATKAQTDAVLSRFPVEQDVLFSNWMSEFSPGAFGKVESAVKALNVVNRFQEFVIRRAVFQNRLERALQAEGKSLEDIISRNAIGEIPRETVQLAVRDSLEMTWSKGFNPESLKHTERLAGTLIKAVNELPGATVAIPFPRFLMNAIKFQYEWSPMGYLRLLSPAQREAMAAGDFSAVSRATVGTGLLLAAHQFRGSEYAGEKWYEAKLPDGRIVDLRPFNPFASYLFLGDLIKRRNEGTLDKLTAHDITMGVLSTQMRAGTGAYMLDTLLEGIAGLDMSEKGVRAIRELAGNYISGFTVPFNTVADFIAEFDESQRTVRSGREGPDMGPISLGPVQRGIPYAKDALPEVYSPLRPGPLRAEDPLLKQLTGFRTMPAKNPVEAEFDRLGLTRKEFFASTGDPTADRLVASRMGPIVAQHLPALVEHPGYKALAPAVQSYLLLESLKEIRKEAMEEVSRQEPALAAKLRVEGIPGRKRKAIDALTGGKVAEALDLLRGATEELKRPGAAN